MATQLQLRRGTTTEHSTFVGAVGEVTVDTTKDTLVVHDGATTAGFPLAKESTVTALDSAAVHKTGDETVAGTKTLSSNPVLSAGTANGVAYLNGSKVLTSGSALTFDGTNLNVGSASIPAISSGSVTSGVISARAPLAAHQTGASILQYTGSVGALRVYGETGVIGALAFNLGAGGSSDSEQMRLTSTGLGIGTSSPVQKLSVVGSANSSCATIGGALYGGSPRGLTIGTYQSNGGDDCGVSFNAGLTGYGGFKFTGGSTTYATIDSSGNLGLGVTPSAWGSGKSIEVGYNGNAVWSYSQTDSYLTHNATFTDAWRYTATAAASTYRQSSGAHYWNIAPSGTAGNAISFTQAMTLDASGNLGVGATSPTARIHSNASIKADQNVFCGDSYAFVFGSGTTSYWTGSSSTNYIAGFTNNTERMRIDSSGNLLVGTTTNSLGGSSAVIVNGVIASGAPTSSGYSNVNSSQLEGSSGRVIVNHSGTATGSLYAGFAYNGAGIGSITQNGTTAVAYNTSSDYRLKENIQPMQGALNVVDQLNPVTYTWKADGSDGQGFIAHELQAVVPDCVTGEKDAVDAEGNPVYQGIDTSFLVATLTKAIQELNEKVTQQAAEIAALKGA